MSKVEQKISHLYFNQERGVYMEILLLTEEHATLMFVHLNDYLFKEVGMSCVHFSREAVAN